jgi:hypothetical protein
MPNRLGRFSLCAIFLTGAIGCLLATGCGGGEEAPPSPTSEQYKEAKRLGNEARAKEYGRRSIDDPKATQSPPPPQGKR